MTAPREFWAPSKLMIAGEYSVLGPDGQALAAAVFPGVEVRATPHTRWSLSWPDHNTAWMDGAPVPRDLHFAHQALRTALDANYEGGCYALETSAEARIAPAGTKPGLGGSAAVTAAVTAAVRTLTGHAPDRAEWLGMALDAHTEVQGGMGSGYDVATAVYGGVVLWRPAQLAGGDGSAPGEALSVPWPDGLHVIGGFTGKSAGTTGFLKTIQALHFAGRRRLFTELAELGRSAAGLIDAFQAGETGAILEHVDTCHHALAQWDSTRELGIITPEIEAMIRLAGAAGAVAKVSGAGGGDSVLAFAGNPTDLRGLADNWRAGGFHPFEVTPSDRGAGEMAFQPA